MRPVHRFVTPAVLLLLALGPTTGCGPVDSSQISPALIPEHVNVLRLRISSFDTTRPEGLWLWRLSRESGQYEPVSEIRFGETVVEADREYVSYRLLDPGEPTSARASTRGPDVRARLEPRSRAAGPPWTWRGP